MKIETDKRQKILETMLRLVVDQGLQATPMSQVVKESGVAAGTIYHHFSSKEEILNELYLQLKKDFGQALQEGVKPNEEYRKTFDRIWFNLYNYFINRPLAFQFAEQLTHSSAITPETRSKGEAYYQPVLEFFTSGIKQKLLRKMPVKLMTNLIYGNVVTSVHLTLSGELKLSSKQIRDVIDSSWDSIVSKTN